MPEMTLRASISAYLDEVTVHRNPTTARTYRGALLGLVKYLEESAAVNVDTMEASEVPLDLVVGYFKGLGRLSPSTIEVYFWAIYGWYRFLALNQLTNVDLPKVKQSIQKCIPKRVAAFEEPPNYQDISRIVDYALKLDATEYQSNQERLRLLRDRALIVTLADTGIEVGIVCHLRRNDIDRVNYRLRIVEGSRTSWGSVTPRVIKTISDYLDVRLDVDKCVGRSPTTLPVFSRHRPSEIGKIVALTPGGVRSIVLARALEALGSHYDGSITPKALRHYAVASLLPSLTTLHPRIVKHCKSHFENGQYDNAIFNAMKAIEEDIRTRIAPDPTEIGVNLITTAMKKEPIQKTFSSVAAEQDAHYNLFEGAIGTLKNPHSHRFVGVTDPIRAFESLALASLLMRMLDEAT